MSDLHEPTLIQSVQRAFRLLEAVSDLDERATAKALAHRTAIALPTAYHLLRTLVHDGYLQRLGDGTYALGQRMDAVAGRGRPARAVAQARPALEWLRDELRSPVYLALYHDGEIVVAEIVDSPRAPSIDLWVGIHDAAHATALGKCILAHLDPDEREDYLSRHPLHALTPHTLVDRAELRHRIEESSRIATDREEYALGVTCAAIPVVTDSVIGSVGFATPLRHPDLARAGAALAEAGGRVQRALALA
jgi:DNA-binding IclR family transcriptional regulator